MTSIDFMWYVTIYKPEYSLGHYQQLARLQNLRHGPSFYVVSTFLDLLLGIRVDFDDLKMNATKVRAHDVVRDFDVKEIYTTSTMVPTACFAKQIPHSVLILIQKRSNLKDPALYLYLHSEKLNSVCAETVNELTAISDCRLYQKFMHSSALKIATVFMGASKMDDELAQLTTIYRSQFLCKNTNFEAVTTVFVFNWIILRGLLHIKLFREWCNAFSDKGFTVWP